MLNKLDNMKKILISAPYLQLELDKYKHLLSDYDVIVPKVEERLNEDQLIKIFNNNNWDISSAIVGDDKFTPNFYDLAHNTKLKSVVKWGTGIDSLNKDYAATKDIKVLNTPNALLYLYQSQLLV